MLTFFFPSLFLDFAGGGCWHPWESEVGIYMALYVVFFYLLEKKKLPFLYFNQYGTELQEFDCYILFPPMPQLFLHCSSIDECNLTVCVSDGLASS